MPKGGSMAVKLKKNLKAILIIFMVSSLFVSYNVFFRDNDVEALSKYGSRGEEVRTIQTKLKRWGYYNGNVDGIYGSQTMEAVKKFQRKNGLTADGIAGTKTLQAMGIYSSSGNSSSSNSSSSTNSSDLNLLSRLVYGEARGEPYNGQVAVAAVVLNRVKIGSIIQEPILFCLLLHIFSICCIPNNLLFRQGIFRSHLYCQQERLLKVQFLPQL